MGKVEDPHDPECQRKSYSQQSIDAAQEKAADENLNHFIIALKMCSLFSLEKPGALDNVKDRWLCLKNLWKSLK
jgi:hypothetical protein